MSDSEMKPCPFCGDSAVSGKQGVYCINALCIGNTLQGFNKADWNTRSPALTDEQVRERAVAVSLDFQAIIDDMLPAEVHFAIVARVESAIREAIGRGEMG